MLLCSSSYIWKEDFIGKRLGYDFPDAQPNPPQICQIPLRFLPFQLTVPPREFVEEEEKISEQKISLKGDGDGNGAKVFASILHFWYYNSVTIFSLRLLAYAYHVEFQLVKKNSSLYVTVFFLIYMDKLVCSNSDSNKEDIREH